MKKTLIAIIFTTFSFFASAQDLTKYVPKEAFLVATLHHGHYRDKVDLSKYKDHKLSNMTNISRYRHEIHYNAFNNAFRAPQTMGIRPKADSHIFAVNLDSMMVTGYIYEIQDRQKVESYFNKLQDDIDKENEGSKEDVVFKSKYAAFDFFSDRKTITAYSQNTLILLQISGRAPRTDIDYDEPNYYKKIEKREELFKVKKGEVLEAQMKSFIDQKSSITSNPNFQNFSKESFDLGVWVNFHQIQEKMMKEMGYTGSRYFGVTSMIQSQYGLLLKDNYTQFLVNFEKEHIKARIKQYNNKEMQEITKNLYSDRINPNFYNYINGKELLGLFTVAIDPNKLYDASRKIYKPMLEKNNDKYAKIAAATMDVLDIFIDEDDILGMIKGDMVVAVTDVKEVMITKYESQYDGDTYLGRVPTKKPRTQPVFISMLGLGNVKNVEKLIKLLEVAEGATNKGKYYEVEKIRETPIYFTIKDQILFVTNDLAFVEKNINKGIKKRKQVDEKLQALTKQYTIALYFDINRILGQLLNNDNPSGVKKIEMTAFRSLFENVTISGVDMQNGVMTANGIFRFKKGTGYSIKGILETLKDLEEKSEAYRAKRKKEREAKRKASRKKGRAYERSEVIDSAGDAVEAVEGAVEGEEEGAVKEAVVEEAVESEVEQAPALPAPPKKKAQKKSKKRSKKSKK